MTPALLAVVIGLPLCGAGVLLALALIRRHRRDPYDPVFGEGRDPDEQP